jgi:LysM repeat protein
VGLPEIPRLAVMAVAIGIAALALFFLPAILGLGGPDSGGATPPPSVSPSPSAEPTATPVPTPAVYVIKKGDTLSKIATQHGLTLDQLMTANPQIKDPNKITEGQQIVIPTPDAAGASAAPPGSAAP